MAADKTIDISEIFYSIIGEGPDTGRPAIFLRLAGCNFNCKFCDADCDSTMETDTDTLASDLSRLMGENKCDALVITGGEPTLQVENLGLMLSKFIELAPSTRVIQVESNGYSFVDPEKGNRNFRWIGSLLLNKGFEFRYVISPKFKESSYSEWMTFNRGMFYVKLLVESVADLKDQLLKVKSLGFVGKVYVQPLDNSESLARELIPELNGNILSMQVHKFIKVR